MSDTNSAVPGRYAPDSHSAGHPIITVIGDGQLARMMQPEAVELGQSLRVLASSTANSAAQVIPDVVLGDYKDLADLRRAANGATVVTFDHEHVPTEHLVALQQDGVSVQPAPQALVCAQDKIVMRKKLREIGAPVPVFMQLTSPEDAHAFWHAVSGQVCIKAARGGYDGHGVWFPDSAEEAADLVAKLTEQGTEVLAERKVALVRELSAMIARRPSGEYALWPVVESVQKDGICWVAISPAPEISPELAARCQQLAVRIAEELDVTGVLAVELFEFLDEDGNPDIAVNELAMRPHNTGHWTQDGSVTSQFEQHLRAVADMPLGATDPTAQCTVMANVLGGPEDPSMPWSERMVEVWKRFPQAKIHFYGKDYRPGRKIGHVNMSAGIAGAVDDNGHPVVDRQTAQQVRRDALAAAHFLVHARWPEKD